MEAQTLTTKNNRKKQQLDARASEEALRIQERKLSLIYQNVSEILFSLSVEPNNTFRFISINQPFLDATGLQEKQVVGKTVNEVIPEPSLTMVIEKYNRAISEKATQRWEEITVYPSGKKYGEVTVAPLFDSSGRCIYLIGNVHDITERKEMERQLKDKERLAAIGTTAGMVGHDIRNPLQAIVSDLFLWRLDLAAMPEGEIKESMRESLDDIDRNVLYINKIVQDLQDYAKPITPEAKQVDIQSVIQEVLAKKAIPENIETSFVIGAEAEKITTDHLLLKRILANLVNNAVQAMPNGGKLRIKTSKKTDTIVISVEDTGVGVSDEIKPKLFKPLVTSKSKGQGFGLAVVKRLSEALDGAVSFESEKNKGSKFIIKLPIK